MYLTGDEWGKKKDGSIRSIFSPRVSHIFWLLVPIYSHLVHNLSGVETFADKAEIALELLVVFEKIANFLARMHGGGVIPSA